jgi:hypothetical protein
LAFDPLHKEGDAFRALVYFVAAVAAIVIVVLVIQALS